MKKKYNESDIIKGFQYYEKRTLVTIDYISGNIAMTISSKSSRPHLIVNIVHGLNNGIFKEVKN